MSINLATLASIPPDQRAEYVRTRPPHEMVENGYQRIDFDPDWLASADGQAWLGGHDQAISRPVAAKASQKVEAQTAQPTGTQALLEEARRQEQLLAGASRGETVIRINLPATLVSQFLQANPALAWVVSQVDSRRGRDPGRPSPTALAAGLLAAATLQATGVEHAVPDITWQAAKAATVAAAEAAKNADNAVKNADSAVDRLCEVLADLGGQIADATAKAAVQISREVSSATAVQVADVAATAALKTRTSDERMLLRMLASLLARDGDDPASLLGSDAAVRVENAARAQAAELLATDAGREGRL
jgi:hypothetical protein